MSSPSPEYPSAPAPQHGRRGIPRRGFLVAGAAAAAGLGGLYVGRELLRDEYPVFLAGNQRYDGPLEQTITAGLEAVGLDLAALDGKRVLLKPNLVEPAVGAPQIVTHPAMVQAAAEVFRRHGASVTVGEGPGHMRDTEQILEASRMGEALADARLEFRDLNYEEVSFVQNRGRVSQLRGFYFPAPIVQADLVVSMPKLKTHHWVGVTCSMKNLYGTLPGLKYGWPKNVLHYAGIPQTVVDINASLPRTIAIVDGVTCMEGDGPILGTPKPLGLIAVGVNPMSVDATCARIMGLDPAKVSYMQLGDGRLGTVAQNRILQRGESWQSLASPFQIMEVEHLQALRATGIS